MARLGGDSMNRLLFFRWYRVCGVGVTVDIPVQGTVGDLRAGHDAVAARAKLFFARGTKALTRLVAAPVKFRSRQIFFVI